MFHLEFLWVEDFGKHLQSNKVREAFVWFRNRKNLPEDRTFAVVYFTSRVNDYIALCTQQMRTKGIAPGSCDEYKDLKKVLEELGISITYGCWTSAPPPNLSGIEMI